MSDHDADLEKLGEMNEGGDEGENEELPPSTENPGAGDTSEEEADEEPDEGADEEAPSELPLEAFLPRETIFERIQLRTGLIIQVGKKANLSVAPKSKTPAVDVMKIDFVPKSLLNRQQGVYVVHCVDSSQGTSHHLVLPEDQVSMSAYSGALEGLMKFFEETDPVWTAKMVSMSTGVATKEG